MLASELIKALQEQINTCGDLFVFSTGYYGDVEVTGLDTRETTKWPEPFNVQNPGYTVKGSILLPGSVP